MAPKLSLRSGSGCGLAGREAFSLMEGINSFLWFEVLCFVFVWENGNPAAEPGGKGQKANNCWRRGQGLFVMAQSLILDRANEELPWPIANLVNPPIRFSGFRWRAGSSESFDAGL